MKDSACAMLVEGHVGTVGKHCATTQTNGLTSTSRPHQMGHIPPTAQCTSHPATVAVR